MLRKSGVVLWTAVGRSLRGLIYLLALAGLSLDVGGCSSCGDGAGGMIDNGPTLASLSVSPPTQQTPAGTRVIFSAAETFSDGAMAAKPNDPRFLTLEWSTSDTTIAVVDANGQAKGLKPGSVQIFATEMTSGISGMADLVVTDAVIVAIDVTPAIATTPKDTKETFVATARFSDGTKSDVTSLVTWSTTNTSVATIGTGDASALTPGQVTIFAKDPTTNVQGTALLTVTSATLQSLQLTPPNPFTPLGTIQALGATGIFTDGSTKDLTTSVVWNSSNTKVASISVAGVASGDFAGKTTITATDTASGIKATTQLTVTAAALLSIDLTPSNPSIAKGTSQPFSATGLFSDGTTQNLTAALTWSTSAPSVVSISNSAGSEGNATGLDTGSATITALDTVSGRSRSTTLTVTAALLTSIGVTPSDRSIAKGSLQPFTATGVFSDGSTQNLTASVTWSSSAPSVAAISNAAGSEGSATGLDLGDATITALDAVSGLSGSTTLKVTVAMLTSIDVAPANPSIAKGTSQPFTATGIFSDGTTQILTALVTWSSSVPSVATISNGAGSEGSAASVGVGSTLIKATDVASGVSGSTTLKVTNASLVSIDVAPVDPSMAVGTGLPLIATGNFNNGTTQDLTAVVTWSSSATGIASVSNAAGSEGLASATATGTAIITATDPASGVSGSTTVTVTPLALSSIQVTPATSSVAKGSSSPYTATGIFTDGSSQDLTTQVSWSSSNPSIATISNAPGSEGLASAAAVGTVTITATFAGSGISGTATLTVSAATLVRIDVTPVNTTVPKNSEEQYFAVAIFSDASAVDVTDSVTWSSSKTSIATISNSVGTEGIVTTIAPGSTTITALDAATGISGFTTLTVSNATIVSIVVTPAGAKLADGGKLQFTATATYSNGQVRNVTNFVSWSSSKPGFAGIGNAPRRRGIAIGKSPGTVTITATDSASGVSGSTTLTITNATLVSLSIAPMNATIPKTTKLQYKATGTYNDGSTADLTTVVSWSSSNTAAATINSNGNTDGLATAVGSGMTTITALDSKSGISVSTPLSVTNVTLVSIAVTPSPASVFNGQAVQMKATATFSDGSTKDVTLESTWATANTAIASVSNISTTKGVVSAISVGSTTVSATYPQTTISGSATVQVNP